MCYRLEQLSQQRTREDKRDRETAQQTTAQREQERREPLPSEKEDAQSVELEAP